MLHPRSLYPLVGLAALGVAWPAMGQLREQQTLVVYDSRIADSLAVAEFYAGSARVPAGAGSMPGVHPNVLVLDIFTRLATSGGGQAGVFPAQADIDYATFKSRLRDPLRAYLTQQSLTTKVRCIVLTKGLPHRILNMSNTSPLTTTIGDSPSGINAAFNAGISGNFTYCAVDAELALLQQSLDVGETGAQADSRADGMIVNPYWRSVATINGYSSKNILTSKTLTLPGPPYNGLYWLNGTNPALATTLTPGDLYLVARLDGNTVAAVTGMISRAQNLTLPLATAKILLDSDGNTIDGSGSPPQLDAGPDYALTRTALLADGRFPTSNIVSNTAGGFTGFYVGPNLAYPTATNGPPLVLADPVLLLASFGSNHSGVNGNGSNAGTTYATSFNFLPGAIFNTIESYNGRSFGGIGGNPFVPQQQAADALAGLGGTGGCTFAIGNVWEPFALSVADNDQLVKNFLLGTMTWVEAAYTALPALSWQQIVVGDPLARPRRDREDINGDGQTTIDDLYAWQQSPVDLSNNGVADDTDFKLLEAAVRAFEPARMKSDQR
jgi:hypothetical protein